ncbi:MAG: 16S rRNA (cytidine(1402)-2'-O)-methyltransferase [Acidobacteriota bacterium]|nr:MAG: 16S rRNA (cytidine(1402)-2'-O)-methyltransferase [Acidobacteriota bacterium]
MKAADCGTLFVVATPIGHLGDLSARAVEALARADVVAAEDTRRTGKLLAQLDLKRPLVSCHKFSEARVVGELVERVLSGQRVALVSDGGTPAVSDPGSRLVQAAHEAGCSVVAIPGPCAVAAALSVAGLPADRYLFAGFLPPRRTTRRKALAELARWDGTLVVFEAPHRLHGTLDDALELLGNRTVVLCRELTKLHEEVWRGSVSALRARMQQRARVRGEIVLVFGPPETSVPAGDAEQLDALHRRFADALEAEEGDEKRALRRLARELGLARGELKRRLFG